MNNTEKEIQKKQDNNQNDSQQSEQKHPTDQYIVPSTKKVTIIGSNVKFTIDPQYTVQKIIGIGTYSIVAAGENINLKKAVAIKKISNLFKNLPDARRILREIKILKFLSHNNIVTLIDIMKIQQPYSFNQIYLCMDRMQFDLKAFIKSKIPITEHMIKYIMFQILHGLYYMHSAQILHRDLKPQNILMNTKCQLKIADMNLAKKGGLQDQTFYVVSRPYRALQLFISPNNYNKSIDIWSAGCILAQLLGRTVLFQGKDFLDQIKRFVAILGKPKLQIFTDIDPNTRQGIAKLIGDIPERQKIDWKYLLPNASEQALNLLDNMLQYDTKKRFTAQDCLNHPFLESFKQVSRVKCTQFFDFSFDKLQMKTQTLRKALFEESLSYQLNKNLQQKKQQQQQQKIQSQPRKIVKTD